MWLRCVMLFEHMRSWNQWILGIFSLKGKNYEHVISIVTITPTWFDPFAEKCLNIVFKPLNVWHLFPPQQIPSQVRCLIYHFLNVSTNWHTFTLFSSHPQIALTSSEVPAAAAWSFHPHHKHTNADNGLWCCDMILQRLHRCLVRYY